jgi:hypothetical protein
MPVDVLRSYLNRADLLYDLSEAVQQLSASAADTESISLSVQTVAPGFRQCRTVDRLTDADVSALITAFVTGTPRWQLAERYGISLRSVGRLLQKHGVRKRRKNPPPLP